MKKKLFTLLLALVAIATTGRAQNKINGHEYVDLGLPSGTLWATCNVGATKPEEYGDYFAWGETEKKDAYNWSNYPHCDGSSETSYSLDGNISGTQYDVAHVKWGTNWRMPTLDEIEELVNNCTYTVTELNSVKVMKLTGPNGNFVYLPFAGYMDGTEHKNIGYDSGYYWSGVNPYTNSMAPCMMPSANGNVSYNNLWQKYLGLTVRPVIKAASSDSRTFIDLGLPSGTKWANMNVGASRPEEYGTYFAWGETLGKNSYTWDNYMCPEMTCGKSGDPVFDLVGVKADIAGTKFDAATMNWGASWQMPTAKQIEELASNCYSSLVTINGVQCRKLKSRINGNEIVFPLAGARWYESFAYEGSLCYYWGSTLRQGGYVSPGRLIVEDDRHGWGWSMGGENDRFCGFPIRPIYKGSSQPEITSDSCLIVWHKDGSIVEFELKEKPKLVFNDSRVEVITSSINVEYDFSAIEKMTYELKTTDAIPELPSDYGSVPFVAEGGHIKFYSSKEDLNIKIFSLNGNLIKQHFVKCNESYSFPLHSLPKGVYLIRVNNVTYKISTK